ncbi:putative reverse transcriptase domain-containing protein [Tanacetum coccineum]
MSFDPRLLAYVESLICILAFDSIFVVILFDCCNPWSSLISLNHGSFDVIIGMDWLSKRKFVIVCHEKVVRIPLEGDEILRVHGVNIIDVFPKEKFVEDHHERNDKLNSAKIWS